MANYAAQRLLGPTRLPIGVFTVVIAGAYFAVLLLRAARVGAIG